MFKKSVKNIVSGFTKMRSELKLAIEAQNAIIEGTETTINSAQAKRDEVVKKANEKRNQVYSTQTKIAIDADKEIKEAEAWLEQIPKLPDSKS